MLATAFAATALALAIDLMQALRATTMGVWSWCESRKMKSGSRNYRLVHIVGLEPRLEWTGCSMRPKVYLGNLFSTNTQCFLSGTCGASSVASSSRSIIKSNLAAPGDRLFDDDVVDAAHVRLGPLIPVNGVAEGLP